MRLAGRPVRGPNILGNVAGQLTIFWHHVIGCTVVLLIQQGWPIAIEEVCYCHHKRKASANDEQHADLDGMKLRCNAAVNAIHSNAGLIVLASNV